jgi:PIN domain nuclease of toxin-antitoxin system
MTITSTMPASEAIETTLRIMVSAISLWEIAIKVRRDGLTLPIAGLGSAVRSMS